MVRKLKIYVDTSVFGGTQDKEFEKFSRRFFDRVLQNQYIVLLSDETLRELVKAPDNVSPSSTADAKFRFFSSRYSAESVFSWQLVQIWYVIFSKPVVV